MSTALVDEKRHLPPDVEKAPEVAGEAPIIILKHANDADEAMKAFSGYEGDILVLDEATNKRLLRKIDLHLMPVNLPRRLDPSALLILVQLLCVIYGLNYLDSMPMVTRFVYMIAYGATRNDTFVCFRHGHQEGYWTCRQ